MNQQLKYSLVFTLILYKIFLNALCLKILNGIIEIENNHHFF